jgi:NAD(P)-dependent dehydrogenase (short-subunit alcohol dehydrogenase family)
MSKYPAPTDGMLRDRTLMVTGAGDGIGRALAIACARLGATVILVGRTLAKLEAVYDAIEAAGGPQPALIPLNLLTAGRNDYTQVCDIIDREFGRLDGLIHCAAQLGELTQIESYPLETFESTLKINVTAGFALTQALLPLIRRSRHGRIIFTTSTVGRQGRAHWGAYAVSKFAVEGLMQTLADEFEHIPNVRVFAVNPGATRTNMRALAFPAEDPAKVTAVEAILPAFLHLLSDAGAALHGQSIDAQA